MSEEEPRVCPSCGARLPQGADVCDLCGTPVSSVSDLDDTTEAAADAPRPPEERQQPASAKQDDGPYCNQCGWQNPPGARFCSQCGTRLQDVSAASKEQTTTLNRAKPASPPPAAASSVGSQTDASDQQQGVRRQVGILVGAGVLLVMALFLLLVYNNQGATRTSDNASVAGPPSSAQTAPPAASGSSSPPASAQELTADEPLPEHLGAQADSFKTVIGRARGAEKTAAQRELVNLYVGAGRRDLAAVEQEKIAKSENTVEDWTKAGHLLYDWMSSIQDPQRKVERGQIAQLAINAYQRVLEQDPDNVDVRTDMATAYLETNNPMQGVQQIKRVLEQEPDHLEARFNYGLMLAMIGRTEKALDQFERAKEIAGEGSPYYQQADRVIQNIRQRMNARGS